MTLPPAAAAQDRTPTPSARELWDAYPLQQDPSPEATRPAAGPAGRRSAAGPSRPANGDGPPLDLLGAAAALAGLGAVLLIRGRRASHRPGARAPVATPLLVGLTATTALSGRTRSGRLTALAGEDGGTRQARSADRGGDVQDLRPPDPHRPWTAELEWCGADDGARFCVTALPDAGGPHVRIACSDPIEWPPPDAAAVQRLRRSVTRMEAVVCSAGWTPLPPGDAWYSKRFAWAPVAEPVPEPGPEAPVRLFPPQPAWPRGTEALWRCEIRWRAGYVRSRFTAVAHMPGSRGATTVVSSSTFKWMIKADPDPPSPELRSAVAALDEQITAAGWEPAGSGRDWWELRYVWRGDDLPPLVLEGDTQDSGVATR